jgi:methyl-accepting chemotaxis protein
MEDEDKKSLNDGLKESVNLLGNIGRIQDGIVAINSGFGESRQRVLEFNNVLADSAGGIKRLGGNITDVAATVTEIAQGARRNVVATTDVVTDLFAVSQFLGKETSGIVDSFAAAGIEMTTIGDTILESVQYVQSVGLNAKTIMGSVVEQTDLLNRFNFDGGVQGFTRMAAQASMVRLDMSKTAAFADKVMNPQGALETAQAFQRLGVAAGTLIDPFALMDASINDPEGLQDSLIEMTRQFTQFNDETGRFEINPGGVRLMHDLAEAAGMT